MEFDAGELETILFALEEYKKNLKKTVSRRDAGIEDHVFCYETLAKVAKLEYKLYNGDA